MKPDLVVRGRRVMLPSGIAPAAIHISGGVIAAIEPYESVLAEVALVDAGELVILPGVVIRVATIGKALLREHVRPPLAE